MTLFLKDISIGSLIQFQDPKISKLSLNYCSDVIFASAPHIIELTINNSDLNSILGINENKQLKVLDVSNNNLTELTLKINLKELYAQRNKIFQVQLESTLQIIDLKKNRIQDTRLFKNITCLKELHLQCNEIITVAPLQNLKLIKLYLSGNRIVYAPEFFKQIKYLHIDQNYITQIFQNTKTVYYGTQHTPSTSQIVTSKRLDALFQTETLKLKILNKIEQIKRKQVNFQHLNKSITEKTEKNLLVLINNAVLAFQQVNNCQ
ncbi:leucine-rich_repeat domain-containing protein [Hexamita inflata]|uniref:Leucine-rich repeat domain-containing protein n=1 Tax=Hexamita inflata TaxID=28002 RepID=A0AA86Q756_9EUKA|nr:leucine-rich repeat domain-containing protein [Hexamita inflata]